VALLDLLQKAPIPGGKLEDGWAGRAEGPDLLAGEDVVVFPVLGEGEGGADAPEEVALAV
jgi:hypothetical protein